MRSLGHAGTTTTTTNPFVPPPPWKWAPTCHINATSDCRPESLSKEKATLIIPGGNTTCILGDPYKFAYYPGHSKKLLIFFAGGGAAWAAPGKVGNMLEFPSIGPTTADQGIFNANDSNNPFRSWTIVYINYCTGDCLTGTATDEWIIKGNKTRVQLNGYANTMSAVMWAKQHVGRVNDLVIGGSSAGSLGIMAWAKFLIDTFAKKPGRASVFMDSFAGYFPDAAVGDIMHQWGTCLALRSLGHAASACEVGASRPYDWLRETLADPTYSDVQFGAIQSKADQIQILFYDSVAKSFGLSNEGIGAADFYNGTNTIFQGNMGASVGNYGVFYVDGSTHEFTVHQHFYTTTTKGKDNLTHGGTVLNSWLSTLIIDKLFPPQMFQCSGDLVQSPNSTEFCDVSLIVPKNNEFSVPQTG